MAEQTKTAAYEIEKESAFETGEFDADYVLALADGFVATSSEEEKQKFLDAFTKYCSPAEKQ